MLRSLVGSEMCIRDRFAGNIKWINVHFWHTNYFKEQNIIQDDEKIKYFYTDKFFSFRKDANIVTDKWLLYFWREDDGSIFVERTNYDDIDYIIERETEFYTYMIEIYTQWREYSNFVEFDSSEYYKDIKRYIDKKIAEE